ncbi:MAG: hypothetical protein QOG46_1517 [Pseudonocardiales bacterium]|nr:hypothetical protein [Pseudonocardiales bacterium]
MTTQPISHPSLLDGIVAVEPPASPAQQPSSPPMVAGTAARGASVDSSSKQSPSLHDLIDAWKEPYRPRYALLLREFEIANSCKVKETYFAQYLRAGAILVSEKPARGTGGAGDTMHPRLRRSRSPSTRTNIFLSYNSGIVLPRFAYVVMTLRRYQRESSILLKGRSQDILVQDIYTTILYLLNVLDSVNAPREDGADGQVRASVEQSRDRMKAAIDSADAECRVIEQKLRECSRRTALSGYLIGLPVGLALVAFLVFVVAQSRFNVGHLASNSMLAICLATGAVGALLSVMARITRGEHLHVRDDLGFGVTILAGGFRPIVGAVLGAVLYVLILGGLVPMAIPSATEKVDVGLFFAGVAFFAGFSERWAQDTIVLSVPRGGPSPTRDINGEKSAN